jgi:hypothetical protein
VNVALYATIWTALALFVAAEAGWRRESELGARGPRAWAWPALVLGAALMASHVLIALGLRYGWNHEAAVAETARQAAAVYGFEWRGNIYVSYAFVLFWFVEVWRRRARMAASVQRPGLLTWVWRSFFFLIIFNGAIVFATTPWSRALGALLVAALVRVWWPDASRTIADRFPLASR